MHHQIDIIVSVYNRSAYIPNLISQLEKQTFRDFRVIFVDDGSQDDSYEVLQRSMQDVGFDHLLIRQETGGAAAARNTGLRAAQADWIGFMDSDDCAVPEYLSYLHRAATETNADLAICGYRMIPEGAPMPDSGEIPFTCRAITPAQAMQHYCTGWLGVYCLLFKRETQQKKNVFFDENCRYCEDAPFITEVIEAAASVALIDEDLYYYCTNQGSLSRSPKLDKFLSGIQSFEIMEQKMLLSQTDAAAAFNRIGSARYYIATLRKAAVQMPYRDFSALAKRIDYRRYRSQIPYLPKTAKLASYLLLLSRRGFYYGIRTLFND